MNALLSLDAQLFIESCEVVILDGEEALQAWDALADGQEGGAA